MLKWYSLRRLQMANVEATEQPISIILFLLLVLTNVDAGLRCVILPLGMLMESVADFLLALFNSGEPSVNTSEVHRLLMVHGRWMMMMMMMAHVWTTEAWRMVVEAPCKEGHASSLDVAGDLLVLLLLVLVEIPVLPLCTRSMLP
jgi:hypothetical protein